MLQSALIHKAIASIEKMGMLVVILKSMHLLCHNNLTHIIFLFAIVMTCRHISKIVVVF